MQDPDKKTILVTVFHSLISKNILNTDAIKELRDSGDYRIVLLVPDHKKAFFEKYYAHADITVEGFSMTALNLRGSENLMNNISKLLIRSHYLHYKRKEILDGKRTWQGYTQYFIRETVVALFAGNRFIRALYRSIDRSFASKDYFAAIFEKYHPHLVFSTDMFEQMGVQFLYEARLRKIRTVGMVRSWDNCLSKGLLREIPEVCMTNNNVIADELVTLHGVDRGNIEVVGLPQFDAFITKKPEDRKSFFEKNGLDLEKRLVMFAPAGTVLGDTDADICDMLVKARTDGRLPPDIQFFVRNHPQHPADLSSCKDVPGFIIQNPGEALDPTTHKETELTPEDQDFLRNILAHTDVLIWVATSLCLDALIYDIPQVVLNFDGNDMERDYYHSVKRYHDEDHMRKMFVHDPFKVANNETELIESIDLYLKNPEYDREGRAIVREQQLYKIDGKSGERVAEIIQKILR